MSAVKLDDSTVRRIITTAKIVADDYEAWQQGGQKKKRLDFEMNMRSLQGLVRDLDLRRDLGVDMIRIDEAVTRVDPPDETT